jgi:transcriptional regulator with XRE-family HTH domain
MHHPNYIAFHRRRSSLTAEDLSALLGYKHRSSVRRRELGDSPPSIQFALACQVVFGVAPAEMFPGLYSQIEETVLLEAAVLDRRLRDRAGEVAARQRKLLLRMVERANSRPLS